MSTSNIIIITIVLYFLPLWLAWYNLNRFNCWFDRLAVCGHWIWTGWVVLLIDYCFMG